MITPTTIRLGALYALCMLALACPGCLGGQSGEPTSGTCDEGPHASHTELLKNLTPAPFFVVEGGNLVGDSTLELRFEVQFPDFATCDAATESPVNVFGADDSPLGQLQGALLYDEENDAITVRASAVVEGWLAPGLSPSVQQATVLVQLAVHVPSPRLREATTYSLSLQYLIDGEVHESTWKTQNETNP